MTESEEKKLELGELSVEQREALSEAGAEAVRYAHEYVDERFWGVRWDSCSLLCSVFETSSFVVIDDFLLKAPTRFAGAVRYPSCKLL